MANGDTQVFLPNGQSTRMPINPDAPGWSDGPPGSHVFASDLTYVVGGTVMWRRQRPMFQGIQTISQSIPFINTSTWAPITLDTALLDNYGAQDGNVSSVITPPLTTNLVNGGTDYYLVSGYIPYNSNLSAGPFLAGILKGGSIYSEGTKVPSGAGHVVDCWVVDLVPVTLGDQLNLGALQVATSSSVSTVVSSKTPSLTMRWVGGTGNTSAVAVPGTSHTWIDADEVTANATGASSQSPGVKVPLNREARDVARWFNGPPLARLTNQGTSQTIVSGAGNWQSLSMPSHPIDNYTGWSSGSPARYTAQRPGTYKIIGYASVNDQLGPAPTGYRAARLLQTFAAGGSTSIPGTSVVPPTTVVGGTAVHASATLRMAVGDSVELQVSQTQGANLSLPGNSNNASRLIAIWMSL